MTLGIMPVTRILLFPLPSYGGSALLMNFILCRNINERLPSSQKMMLSRKGRMSLHESCKIDQFGDALYKKPARYIGENGTASLEQQFY